MKKISIAFIIILLIINIGLANVVNAASLGISGGSVSGEKGKTVTLTFTTTGVSSSLKLEAFQIDTITIPNGLEFESLATSGAGALIDRESLTYSSPQGVDSNVKIYVKLKIKDSTTAGDYNVTINGVDLISSVGTEKATFSATGKVTVKDDKAEETTPEKPKSNDATFSRLSVSGQTLVPSFSPKVYEYTMTVGSDVKDLLFSYQTTVDAATQKISGHKGLEEGTNIVRLVVTAEDGKTTQEYKITVTKKTDEEKEPDIIPNIIEEEEDDKKEEKEEEPAEVEGIALKSLLITGVELSPTFEAGIFEYSANYVGESDSLEVIAIASEEDANMEIVGNTNLVDGDNLITVIITNVEEDDTKTYQIVLNKVHVVTPPDMENEIVTAEPENPENEEGTIFGIKIEVAIFGGLVIIMAVSLIAVKIMGGNNKPQGKSKSEPRPKVKYSEQVSKEEDDYNAFSKNNIKTEDVTERYENPSQNSDISSYFKKQKEELNTFVEENRDNSKKSIEDMFGKKYDDH